MTQTQQKDTETLHHLLEEILAIKDTIKQTMVTKDDLKKSLANHITKADAENFFTKDDAKNDIATFATKEDIRQLTASMNKNFDGTKEDITTIKEDITNLSNKLDATKVELKVELKKRTKKRAKNTTKNTT